VVPQPGQLKSKSFGEGWRLSRINSDFAMAGEEEREGYLVGVQVPAVSMQDEGSV
jgi:hypothetical protein